MQARDPRRYDRIDVILSFGLFLVALWLTCMVIENEGRKANPGPLTAAGDLAPLPLGMN